MKYLRKMDNYFLFQDSDTLLQLTMQLQFRSENVSSFVLFKYKFL